MLSQEIRNYISEHSQETYDLLVKLAQIPAPSNYEEKRVDFLTELLESWGAKGVYTDEALNVVFPYDDDGEKPLVVFMAHTDVVFPDTTPLPLHVDGDKLCCPGVGDDTANLVTMLMVVKYLLNHPMKTKDLGVIFVANSGEEGLGNLKGSRQICKTYGSRMKRFYSFDGGLKGITTDAVGSSRFKVSATTIGGHSYGKFGNPNAIAGIAEVIRDIYCLTVPEYGKTTYNVGTISGGTSVNTIAQYVEMLCEYRSSDLRSMAIMEDHFQKIFKERNTADVHLEVELVGSRPCGALDETARKEQTEMFEQAASILKEYTGKDPTAGAGSTDCNIPLSMNIPSLCYGFYNGQGAHTREEYVEISSLKIGYHVAFESILAYFE